MLLIVVFFLLLGICIAAVGGGWLSGQMLGNGRLTDSATFTGITAVELHSQSCSVEIVPEDNGDAVVAEFYQSGLLRGEVPSWSQEDSVLHGTTDSGFLSGGRIVLRIPSEASLDYKIDNTTGAVSVQVGGGRLQVDTKTGSIKVYKPFDTLDLETKTGSIKAVADGDTTQCCAYTATGSVKLGLWDVAGYTLTASTKTGSVKDVYQDLSYGDSGTFTWGDGSLVIAVETKTGSIKLTDWE